MHAQVFFKIYFPFCLIFGKFESTEEFKVYTKSYCFWLLLYVNG